jgi:arginase family enzyme
LVREPDVLLFGLDRVDPPEQEFLSKSPMRHVWTADIRQKGATTSAKDALAHLHTESREFVLHLDMDIIAEEEFAAVNVPGSGGLRLEEVRAALREATSQKTLLGLDVAQYNPDRDPDGSGAQKLVALLVDSLSARLESAAAEESPSEAASGGVVESEASPVVLPAESASNEPASVPGTSPDASGETSN